MPEHTPRGPAAAPCLVSCRRIWGRARHNAFTDLVRFRERWYCAFREAAAHADCAGRVRVLASADGERWRPAACLAERGVDLRDPKLSVRPDGRLMLLAGGTEPAPPAPRAAPSTRLLVEGERLPAPARSEPRATRSVTNRHAVQGRPGRQPRVFLSEDGRRWSAPRPILAEGDWLWRVTWHDGRAWGVSYRLRDEDEWAATLLAGEDGLEYRQVCELDVPGKPNETTLRFLPDGRMMALVRREGGDRRGWVGVSPPPFTAWEWQPVPHRFGGPNFIVLPDGRLWAAGRAYREDGFRTVLARLGPRSYDPVLELPGDGDCSYPGLAWHDGLLWISYYASPQGWAMRRPGRHRGQRPRCRAAIYLAKVQL